jgi:hypothetical protein
LAKNGAESGLYQIYRNEPRAEAAETGRLHEDADPTNNQGCNNDQPTDSSPDNATALCHGDRQSERQPHNRSR